MGLSPRSCVAVAYDTVTPSLDTISQGVGLVALLRGTTGSTMTSINMLEDIWSYLHETLWSDTLHNGPHEALHKYHQWD